MAIQQADSTGPFSIGGAEGLRTRNYNAALAIGIQGVRYYKLRGKNTVFNSYETWVGLSPQTPPPSGNTLIDIVQITTWTSLA